MVADNYVVWASAEGRVDDVCVDWSVNGSQATGYTTIAKSGCVMSANRKYSGALTSSL